MACPGKAYPTTIVGSQIWMAENLNYGEMIPFDAPYSYPFDSTKVEKFCKDDLESNCELLGAFYNWTEAVQIDYAAWNAASNPPIDYNHRGVCPYGWHIPSEAEWQALKTAVWNDRGGSVDQIATHLKSTTAWPSVGLDTYKWNAIPTGMKMGFGNYEYPTQAAWWSRSEKDQYSVYMPMMDNTTHSFNIGDSWTRGKIDGISVRCVHN